VNKLKRIPIKYIRDFIKKDYKLRDECYICGSTESLELHHLYSVSELFNNWCDKNKIIKIEDVETINTLRVQFSQDCYSDLSHENLYTLCATHHKQLHNIYGQRYSNHLSDKIKNWLNIQRAKNGR
jgi:5-methylcytosine-specific restriction endonuclease McrA